MYISIVISVSGVSYCIVSIVLVIKKSLRLLRIMKIIIRAIDFREKNWG